jgi:hypothetical protein
MAFSDPPFRTMAYESNMDIDSQFWPLPGTSSACPIDLSDSSPSSPMMDIESSPVQGALASFPKIQRPSQFIDPRRLGTFSCPIDLDLHSTYGARPTHSSAPLPHFIPESTDPTPAQDSLEKEIIEMVSNIRPDTEEDVTVDAKVPGLAVPLRKHQQVVILPPPIVLTSRKD